MNSGDKRVNEWTGMTALHNTFLEEHNRIADFFYTKYVKLFPHWTGKHLDEEVYQKTRRILAAQIQVKWEGLETRVCAKIVIL